MKKDKDGNFIGVGEETAEKILGNLFSNAEIKSQYPFINLITDDFKDSLGERYLKHKIDLVIFRADEKPIVVRVQDKHHEGVLTSARDTVQKQILEWNDCIVVDLNWYDCPNLWKEELNQDSINEVLEAFNNIGLLVEV